MLIRKKLPRARGLDAPILHPDHARPVSRRDFISAGLMTGPAVVATSSLVALLARSGRAFGQTQTPLMSPNMEALASNLCNIQEGAGKIPFICFDLAGGANLNGSEILIGGSGGQLDFLSTAGYAKLGLPGDMVPNAPNAASPTNNFINTAFGVAWHSDGAILRGMLERTSPPTQAFTNGCALAARSENDTGNNPHNPMYGIMKTGSNGQLLGLIGSQASDSGGNSAAPMSMIDLANRPTKVDRATDVTGLVDTGELASLLPAKDVDAVLEAITRMSSGVEVGAQGQTNLPPVLDNATGQQSKFGKITELGGLGTTRDADITKAMQCGYVKSAKLANRFATPARLNPDLDPDIVDQSASRGTGIFGQAEYRADGEFRKTAAIMKMVVNGLAGAGTITMGGYDYHTGNRADGELRNLRAGRCIGACLEYAARLGKPLMIYVFSDGSLSAMSTIDTSTDGRGKFGWQGDNQSVANSFFLVYSPKGRPVPRVADSSGSAGKQIGYYRDDGSVETSGFPGANAVNLLADTVVLNYMALHGEEGDFATKLPKQGLGSVSDSLMAFGKIT